MGSSTEKVVWGVVLACCFASCVCLEESIASQTRRLLGSNGKYKIGDEVPLWASKVGPFANPRYVGSHKYDLNLVDVMLYCANASLTKHLACSSSPRAHEK